MAAYGPGKPYSFLADQQNKNSGSYHHCNQNTDDERRNRTATGFDLFRSSALLRRSDAQPEEKFIHRAIPLLIKAEGAANKRRCFLSA